MQGRITEFGVAAGSELQASSSLIPPSHWNLRVL